MTCIILPAAVRTEAQQTGSIIAWGDNTYDQCVVLEPNYDFVGVSAGGHHSLGLRLDGTVCAWGGNNYGQCDVPGYNADFTAVAGGDSGIVSPSSRTGR